MKTDLQALGAGFADPVHDSQRAFRAALDAFSRPGQPVDVGQPVQGLALGPAMAHLLLALTDDGTGAWWQGEAGAAAYWLRFHTGASIAQATQDATFACVADPAAMPALEVFAQGSAAAPECSTTLLVEVGSLDAGAALQWHGPGILNTRTVRVAGLPQAFWTQWQANHAAFPQGVDVVFTCGGQAIGLPRTTRVSRLEAIGQEA